jgi:hypothetical protein
MSKSSLGRTFDHGTRFKHRENMENHGKKTHLNNTSLIAVRWFKLVQAYLSNLLICLDICSTPKPNS